MSGNPFSPAAELPAPLRRRWWLVASLELAATAALYALFLRSTFSGYANRWLSIAGILLLLQLALLHRHLPQNHRLHEKHLLPTLGPGNALTISRGLLLAWLAGFLITPAPPLLGGWLPALLYTTAAIADIFDGYAARRSNHATPLGAMLDMEYDTIGVLTVPLLAIRWGRIPWWFLLLGLARYLFVLGLWWRRRRGRPTFELTDSTYRRIAAGIFMGFLTVMLWPVVHPPGTWIAAYAFGLPFAALFLRDWLVASGAIDPQTAAYRQRWRPLAGFTVNWLPLLWRVVVVAAMTLIAPYGWAAILSHFAQTAVAPDTHVRFVLNSLTAAATLSVALGILPRFTVLGTIFVLAGAVLTAGPTLLSGTALFAACQLALLGPGRIALWNPEEARLMRRRLGEIGD